MGGRFAFVPKKKDILFTSTGAGRSDLFIRATGNKIVPEDRKQV